MTDTIDNQDSGTHGRLRDGYDAVYGRTAKTTAKAVDAASDAADVPPARSSRVR